MYIRTLCADIGDRLGCGGHMSFLLRKKAGIFDLTSSVTLEEIKELVNEGKLQSRMMKTENAFDNIWDIEIDEFQAKKFLNGVAVALEDCRIQNTGLIKVYSEGRRFLALGEITTAGEKLILRSRKFF